MPKINLTKQQQQALGLALLVVIGGGFLYFKKFLQPTLEAIKKNKVKITELSSRVDELEKRAKGRDRLLAEIAQAEATWQTLKLKLPEKRDLPGILEKINQMTRRFRLKLASVNPQAIGGTELYYEIPFQLAFSGSYHDVAMFLEAMGKEERIYRARNLGLGAAAASLDRPWDSVSVTMILVTYQYKGG